MDCTLLCRSAINAGISLILSGSAPPLATTASTRGRSSAQPDAFANSSLFVFHVCIEVGGRLADQAGVFIHFGLFFHRASGHCHRVFAVLGKIGGDAGEVVGPVQAFILVDGKIHRRDFGAHGDVREAADRDQHGDCDEQELAAQR